MTLARDDITAVGQRILLCASFCLALAAGGLSASDAIQETPLHTNRLAQETSPYLLQHAHNPVDWYPWGEEAFAKARAEKKPIFLSVGYSTCHWCHVMEKQSFETEEVAAILNEFFVAIKVDREERPDVDDLYMGAVQMMTGRGGWPMSVWLTPELEPFHGGTYYPKAKFMQLLNGLALSWKDRRGEVEARAKRMADALRERNRSSAAARTLGNEPLVQGVSQLARRFDARNGGFGGRPKFPGETNLLFLLGRYERTGDLEALNIVTVSLEKMAAGGIYDQIGGGFHRYSVDAEWHEPHFEKMLYNQAWLGRAYLEATRLTGRVDFERIVREILEYVTRDMTSPEGAFYTAEDADSEGEEGLFYLWTPPEVVAVLGEKHGALFNDFYGVTPAGNFEHGKSIARRTVSRESFARSHQLDPADFSRTLTRMHAKLLAARAKRERPLRDDKILTGWNGMMIGTFARAGLILREPEYVQAAARAAAFILTTNRDTDGNLLRVHRAGASRIKAFHEDYAYLIDGLLELYRVTEDRQWLDHSRELTDRMLDRFYDHDGEGGFFDTPVDHPDLLVRSKESHDGAVPSGNAVATDDLVRLARFTGETRYQEKAESTLAAFAEQATQSPMGFTYMLQAADSLRNGEVGPRVGDLRGILTARFEPAHADLVEGKSIEARLVLSIRPGWHLNSNRPHDEDLVATSLSGRDLEPGVSLKEIDFPAGEDLELAFADRAMSVYQGEIEIPFRVEVGGESGAGPGLVRLTLRYQACDDRKCLAPAELPLAFALHATDPRVASTTGN